MTEKRIEILRHSLGLTRPGAREYRNHFVTGPGSDDYDACESLVTDGLMRKFKGNPLTGGDPCYVVTEEGKRVARGAAGSSEEKA